MKIKSKNENVKSMKLIVPVDGLITIDENGIADVSPKCAGALVSGTSDWEVVGKASAKDAEAEAPAEEAKEEVNEDQNPAEEETHEPAEGDAEGGEGEDGEEAEKEDKLDAETLNAMTVAQLKDMCSEASLPEKEYKDLKKAQLVEYILNKCGE